MGMYSSQYDEYNIHLNYFFLLSSYASLQEVSFKKNQLSSFKNKKDMVIF